ncbi:MAG: class I SAM-dependent methyltransferase [Verrucomicrobia bacterium]|nr:class I SAM-dependent methyltransferase [Verrucomicrobiota bacterium]
MKPKKCLICGGLSHPLKQIDKYGIFKCLQCALEFTVPMPSAADLRRFYSDYSDFHAPDKTVTWNARKNIRRLKAYGLTRKTRLLDYGCGKNVFVAQGNSAAWHGYDAYNEHNSPALLGRSYDFITMWGVLEHLVDPVETVTRLSGMLHSGGLLVLTTVSTETGIPYRHKPPEHVTYWSHAALQSLYQQCGLELMECCPYQMHQYADIYLRCVLNAAKVPSVLQKHMHWKGRNFILVPTNEVLAIGKKSA